MLRLRAFQFNRQIVGYRHRHRHRLYSIERQRQRQLAEDDERKELAEHNRTEMEDAERLDPDSLPGLYPDLEIEEEPVDDSWYVGPKYQPTPLWEQLAQKSPGPADTAADTMSLFELCQATLNRSLSTPVEVVDVGDRCEWTSRMVVAQATSSRHARAVSEELQRAIKARSRQRGAPAQIKVDGGGSDDWVVVDLGSFVVHVMTPEAYQTYDLVSLWTKKLEAEVGEVQGVE